MTKKLSLLSFLALFVMVGSAHAADEIYTSLFSNKALKGYDTVSYFTEGKPVKGSKNFTTSWKGAQWQFSSQENLDLFKANPEKYAPQYGGYCAWAVANDALAKGDPEHWTITDGKLYLNYDKKIHSQWVPRKAELIEVGNEKFPELIAE